MPSTAPRYAGYNAYDYLDAGKDYGFSMDVLLRIQVEAIQTE